LVELVVTISLLTIVLAIFFNVVASVQTGLVRQTDRSGSNDQARLAVEELDREIRSGNVLYDPASETDAANFIYPGMSLRIYSQTNAPSRESGSTPGARCVQWRIKYNKARANYELQRRDWAKDATTSSGWRVVADHIFNRAVSPQKSAFTVDPAKRIVNVAILVNQNSKHGNTVEVDTTVEGRNTIYGYPNTVCATIPAYPQPDPAEA
jgi:hypothetical protein